MSCWASEDRHPVFLTWLRHKIFDADQVVDRIGKREHPATSFDSLVPGLTHQTNSLQPSKDFFYQLPLPLADSIANMTRRPVVDGTGAISVILCIFSTKSVVS